MKKDHFLFRGLLLIGITCTLLSSCKKDDPEENILPEVKQEDIVYVDSVANKWMTTYGMPGLSLAVSRNGKLVYQKGYGVEDPETGEKVTTSSQFRIASVSKLITSVAVMKLLEEDKISLDQKVFGASGILGTTYGTQPYKTYVTDVTVNDLLHHTIGGWGQNSDPAFFDINLDENAVIDWTLNNQALTSAPGSKFDYSNFGYMLLTKIIEKVSGKTYVQYCNDEIWNKTGAKSSFIAGSKLADRRTDEVKYVGQGSDIPYVYGMNLDRARGAMGWLSTPSDLLRFATAVDSSATRPDILSLSTIQTMVTPTANSSGFGFRFGCGWAVENGEWFWWGTLPGTFAILYRNANGICIAATANSRYITNPVTTLNSFVATIINPLSTKSDIPWQNIDQF